MDQDEQCLHEGNGECSGKLMVVENLLTHRTFTMCEKHADWYYDQQEKIIHRYPEVLQPNEDY